MSEVERFDAYYGYPSCRATGRHIHANGEFVLASDYDALKEYTDQIESAESLCADVYESLKTERDALAAELEAVKAELAHLKMKVENAEKVGVTWTHIYDGEEACGYPGAEEHGEHLSALRSELARVKAESLRVVKDGGPMMKKQTDGNDPLILGSDNELYNQRLSDEIYLMRISGNPAWAELEDDTIVQPVRLERWESSNEAD